MLTTDSDVRQYIDSINFKPIINRLVKEKKWLNEEAEEVVEYYKRFLFLQRKYGAEHRLSPTPEIDEVWHAHILYTKEYHEHSLELFGKYAHHEPEEAMSPALALRSEDFDKMFNNTQELHFKEFGEYIPEVRAYNIIGRIFVFILSEYRRFVRKFNKAHSQPLQHEMS